MRIVSIKKRLLRRWVSNVYILSIYSDNDSNFQAGIKQFFEDEGIGHIITQTHANVAERCIRIMKNMMHDRMGFSKAGWTSMLTPASTQQIQHNRPFINEDDT